MANAAASNSDECGFDSCQGYQTKKGKQYYVVDLYTTLIDLLTMTKLKLTQIEGDYIMSIELKIKSKHLTEEAKIIRHEENKLKTQIRWLREHQETVETKERKWHSLNTHRRWDVRNENRATYLARAYLENKPYNEVEQKRKPENEYTFQAFIVPRVVAMVNKYGKKDATKDDIILWSELSD